MTEKNETTIIERLKDPYSIYSILIVINYVVMIILYFILPVLRSFNHTTEIITKIRFTPSSFAIAKPIINSIVGISPIIIELRNAHK